MAACAATTRLGSHWWPGILFQLTGSGAKLPRRLHTAWTGHWRLNNYARGRLNKRPWLRLADNGGRGRGRRITFAGSQ